MKNKTAKTRNLLGGGGFGSSIKSPDCQKISVRDEEFNQKPQNLINNLAVMLNLFKHLTGKRNLVKDLCLLTSFDVGQILKQHARGFLTLTLKSGMVWCNLLCRNG